MRSLKKKIIIACTASILICSFMSGCSNEPLNNKNPSNETTTSVVDEGTELPSYYPSLEIPDPPGVCGNLSISIYRPGLKEQSKVEIYGNDAIVLTNFLNYIEYNEESCRCMPEYTIETMFGTYGLNLSCPCVRFGDYQRGLTGMQVSDLKKIISKCWKEN